MREGLPERQRELRPRSEPRVRGCDPMQDDMQGVSRSGLGLQAIEIVAEPRRRRGFRATAQLDPVFLCRERFDAGRETLDGHPQAGETPTQRGARIEKAKMDPGRRFGNGPLWRMCLDSQWLVHSVTWFLMMTGNAPAFRLRKASADKQSNHQSTPRHSTAGKGSRRMAGPANEQPAPLPDGGASRIETQCHASPSASIRASIKARVFGGTSRRLGITAQAGLEGACQSDSTCSNSPFLSISET